MKKVLPIVFFMTATAFGADEPQIQVQGNCEIKVVPDRGTISFTAENLSKNQKSAVDLTTTQINNLKSKISSLKLKDLEFKNSNYNVYPVREYEKERYVEKGVRASLSLEVTTSEIERIGEAITSASQVGINNVGSLVTFLSLNKSQNEYLKCLDIAADDARNKAKQLAKKLGFRIGDVIKLNEVPNIIIPPVPERAMMKTMNASADSVTGTQIESGTQQFSTNIQVTFSIK